MNYSPQFHADKKCKTSQLHQAIDQELFMHKRLGPIIKAAFEHKKIETYSDLVHYLLHHLSPGYPAEMLVNALDKLPNIGNKTAQLIAQHVEKNSVLRYLDVRHGD